MTKVPSRMKAHILYVAKYCEQFFELCKVRLQMFGSQNILFAYAIST